MEGPVGSGGGARAQIVEKLLLSLFSQRELERFVVYQFGDEVAHHVAGQTPAQYVFNLVTTLNRAGLLIQESFWEHLLTERPYRKSDITQVRDQVLVTPARVVGPAPQRPEPARPAAFRHLPLDTVDDLVRLLVTKELTPHLRALTSRIDKTWLAQHRPTDGSLSMQTRLLLERMNEVRALNDGSVPMAAFLGVLLLEVTGDPDEAVVKQALAQVQTPRKGPPVPAPPPPNPSVCEVRVPRYFQGIPRLRDDDQPDVHVGPGFLVGDHLVVTPFEVVEARFPTRSEPAATHDDLQRQAQDATAAFRDAEGHDLIAPVTQLIAAEPDLGFALLRIAAPAAARPDRWPPPPVALSPHDLHLPRIAVNALAEAIDHAARTSGKADPG